MPVRPENAKLHADAMALVDILQGKPYGAEIRQLAPSDAAYYVNVVRRTAGARGLRVSVRCTVTRGRRMNQVFDRPEAYRFSLRGALD